MVIFSKRTRVVFTFAVPSPSKQNNASLYLSLSLCIHSKRRHGRAHVRERERGRQRDEAAQATAEGQELTNIFIHICRIFWQQPSRYYGRELQQGQQSSWSKSKHIEENQRMREPTFLRIRLSQIRRQAKNGTNGRIEQSSRGENRAARQGK